MDKLANITRQDLYDLTHAELGIPKSECSNFVDDSFELYYVCSFGNNGSILS